MFDPGKTSYVFLNSTGEFGKNQREYKKINQIKNMKKLPGSGGACL